MHPMADVRGDVEQCIEREARHAAVQGLIDARPRDAAVLCCFRLRPVVLLNQSLVEATSYEACLDDA